MHGCVGALFSHVALPWYRSLRLLADVRCWVLSMPSWVFAVFANPIMRLFIEALAPSAAPACMCLPTAMLYAVMRRTC